MWHMRYTIYTDGSCLKNPGGPGGYASVIFREGEMIEELSGGETVTTSNRMEITAAIVGLRGVRELTRGGFLEMKRHDFPPGGLRWEVQGPPTTRREARGCQAGFDPWRTTLRPHLSPLRTPQATVVALGSFGMGRARACALSAVCRPLAAGRQRHAQTGRQR